MLLLIDRNGEAVFNKEECAVLENVFFRGGHLTECTFDEQFKEEVNKALCDIENDNIPSTTQRTRKIVIIPQKTVLQQLKNNKLLGPDNMLTTQKRWRIIHKRIYTDCFRNLGKKLQSRHNGN